MPRAINPKTGKQLRGFAAMDPKRVSEIGSRGGKMSRGGGRPPKGKPAGEK